MYGLGDFIADLIDNPIQTILGFGLILGTFFFIAWGIDEMKKK